MKLELKTLVIAGLALLLGLASCASAPQAAADSKNTTGDKKVAVQTQEGQIIEADNPLIQYVGRIDFSKPKAPSFAYPGVQINAKFEGSSIAVVLSDSGSQDYFNVTVDGKALDVLKTGGRGSKTYPVAKDLGTGTHTISLYKRTESSCGTATFQGFVLDSGKSLVQADPLPSRKMEFVGDSITCGYGNMISTDHPEKFPFKAQNENSALSWGALTARALDAQFMSTSYSGRGMFRNLDGAEKGTLPELYGVIFPDKPQAAAWDANRYHPDVLVINLGTNDFGSLGTKTDLDREAFDAAYARVYEGFIKTLRSLHGANMKIVCAVGPMMSDYYPQGQQCWTRIQDAVGGLVDKLNAAGDKEVYFLALTPQSSPYGEDWHPSQATHQRMSDEAVEFLKEITGW